MTPHLPLWERLVFWVINAAIVIMMGYLLLMVLVALAVIFVGTMVLIQLLLA